jgi:hypothetical protein
MPDSAEVIIENRRDVDYRKKRVATLCRQNTSACYVSVSTHRRLNSPTHTPVFLADISHCGSRNTGSAHITNVTFFKNDRIASAKKKES